MFATFVPCQTPLPHFLSAPSLSLSNKKVKNAIKQRTAEMKKLEVRRSCWKYNIHIFTCSSLRLKILETFGHKWHIITSGVNHHFICSKRIFYLISHKIIAIAFAVLSMAFNRIKPDWNCYDSFIVLDYWIRTSVQCGGKGKKNTHLPATLKFTN